MVPVVVVVQMIIEKEKTELIKFDVLIEREISK